MLPETHEICRDIQVGEFFFHLHTEPSAVQKELRAETHSDDEVPLPWPWWAESEDSCAGFSAGPFDTVEDAIAACQRFVRQKWLVNYESNSKR